MVKNIHSSKSIWVKIERVQVLQRSHSTGYLYMRSQGASFQEAGRFASAMCTLKLEHNGPFEGSLNDIKTLIKNTDRLSQPARIRF